MLKECLILINHNRISLIFYVHLLIEIKKFLSKSYEKIYTLDVIMLWDSSSVGRAIAF